MKKNISFLLLLFFCLAMPLCFAQGTKEIVFYNWEDYTDKSILEDFQKRFGIKVVLKEFKTQDMLISEMQAEPEKFDVILADDVTTPLLKQYRLLAELDLTKIPNSKFIKKRFRNLGFDPKNKYSIVGPLWGTTAFVINTNFVPADTDSWAVLWDKRYKGKIALFDDYREAMTALLKYSHLSLNTTNPKELEMAEENASLLRENDVEFGDTFGNLEKVMKGELWIAQVYSGDVIYKARDRKDIKYILPKEGFSIWMDTLMISAGSTKKEEAHQLINFLLEPKNAARSANTFSYPTTIEAEAFIDKENLNNPMIYPPEGILKKAEFSVDVGATEREYQRIFNFLKLRETTETKR